MNDFNPDTFEQRNLPFTVKRLSPTIGGEILGIDLSKPMQEETKALIYEALLVYKVIFFQTDGPVDIAKPGRPWAGPNRRIGRALAIPAYNMAGPLHNLAMTTTL